MQEKGAPRVRQPAEWEPHAAVWTAWPSHPEYWEGHIEAARRDVAGMVKALSRPVEGLPSPERVHVWVDAVAAESGAEGTATFVVTRSVNTSGDVSVTVDFGGTADSGDYTISVATDGTWNSLKSRS